MALALHGVARRAASAQQPCTRPHRYRIGRVIHVRHARAFLSIAPLRAWRKGQMQPPRGQEFWDRFERHGRRAKRHTDQRSQGASQRVPREPDVRVRVQGRHVVVEVGRDREVDGLRDERVFDAGEVAFVSSSKAVAHRRPGPVDASTATGEEKIVLRIQKASATPFRKPEGGGAR